ncbi:epoxide hydrolase [Cytobacillus sp.]|uniref:epoxide hydrolase family protein n=1 Tax=Cytobacillus sp. TaxID=2675269 RepID=UPI0028BE61CC|nr:epoxide hydrolase [Cytobacillus sp.]
MSTCNFEQTNQSSDQVVDSIHPFRIEVSKVDLDDLKERLNRARLPDELPGTGWKRGVPKWYMEELSDYWKNSYDWRMHEAQLNEYPQFLTKIDGQNIHFLHIKSHEPDATPLMLIHGWPGSFVEFLDVIGPLTNPRAHGGQAADAFHLVIPSIPGFGYSIPLSEPGWTPWRMAEAFIQLMERLGYKQFGVQGGDTGAFIAPEMGHISPERIIGIHLNALLTFPSGEEGELDHLTEDEQARMTRLETFNDGYLQIQSKSPQTLAYGLNDSPIGQLAWIAEIFKRLSNTMDGLAEQSISRDRILTNVSLYWFTGTAGSSAQVYYESMHDEAAWVPKGRGTVPTGVLLSLSQDTAIRSLAEKKHNIVRWKEYKNGGHFFALEQPEQFVEDVRMFFRIVQS